MQIIPAVLPKDYEELKNKVAQVRGLVDFVQLDICDGRFVSSISWPMNELTDTASEFQKILREEEGMPFWDDVDYELDLMVFKARESFDLFLKLGAKRIVFHIEAETPSFSEQEVSEFKEFLEGIDPYVRDHTEIGIAINTITPISSIEPIIFNIDFVQCMGIEHIGRQGEEFDKKVLSQIRNLKEKYPDLVISVDGGVKLTTAVDLIEAGADRLVIGSAIFNVNDIRGTIKDFEVL